MYANYRTFKGKQESMKRKCVIAILYITLVLTFECFLSRFIKMNLS